MKRRDLVFGLTGAGAAATAAAAGAARADTLAQGNLPAVATMAALKTLDPAKSPRFLAASEPPVIWMRGFRAPQDGGEGFFGWDAASEAVPNGGTVVAAPGRKSGRWIRATSGGALNVKWFGAAGDNVNDDTEAFKAALAILREGDALIVPTGVYKISDKLTMPPVNSWRLLGMGKAEIRQYANNTPILFLPILKARLPQNRQFNFHIADLLLTWNTKQAAGANPHSIAIALYHDLDRPSHHVGHFNFVVERVDFDNGYRGIATYPNIPDENPIWGYVIRDCYFRPGMTGAGIFLDMNNSGSPRCNFENLYFQGRSMSPREPAFFIKNSLNVLIRNLEINVQDGSRPVFIVGCTNVRIDGIHIEACHKKGAWANDTPYVWIQGTATEATIRDFSLINCAIDVPGQVYGVMAYQARVAIEGPVLIRSLTFGRGEFGLCRAQKGGEVVYDGRLYTDSNDRRWIYDNSNGTDLRPKRPDDLTFWLRGLVANQGWVPAANGTPSNMFIASRPGTITGLIGRAGADIAGDGIRMAPTIDGNRVPSWTASIAPANGRQGQSFKAPALARAPLVTAHRFQTGQRLGVDVSTTGGLRPSGVDLDIQMQIVYDD